MLIEDVKKSIVNAGFQDGEKMPSVRRMAERLGLSVNTVHRAYKLLAIDGRLQLVHGKGCFWGAAPSFEVQPEESVYSVVERLFQNDLDSGLLLTNFRRARSFRAVMLFRRTSSKNFYCKKVRREFCAMLGIVSFLAKSARLENRIMFYLYTAQTNLVV